MAIKTVEKRSSGYGVKGEYSTRSQGNKNYRFAEKTTPKSVLKAQDKNLHFLRHGFTAEQEAKIAADAEAAKVTQPEVSEMKKHRMPKRFTENKHYQGEISNPFGGV